VIPASEIAESGWPATEFAYRRVGLVVDRTRGRAVRLTALDRPASPATTEAAAQRAAELRAILRLIPADRVTPEG